MPGRDVCVCGSRMRTSGEENAHKDACFQVAPIIERKWRAAQKMLMKIYTHILLLTDQGIRCSTIMIKGLGSPEESLIQSLN